MYRLSFHAMVITDCRIFRFKVDDQLTEIIRLGLREYEKEMFKRGVRSRTNSNSDPKVTSQRALDTDCDTGPLQLNAMSEESFNALKAAFAMQPGEPPPHLSSSGDDAHGDSGGQSGSALPAGPYGLPSYLGGSYLMPYCPFIPVSTLSGCQPAFQGLGYGLPGLSFINGAVYPFMPHTPPAAPSTGTATAGAAAASAASDDKPSEEQVRKLSRHMVGFFPAGEDSGRLFRSLSNKVSLGCCGIYY